MRLQNKPIRNANDARDMLQTAMNVEFGTLPPYLYAMLCILPGANPEAMQRLRAITHQEMIHLCLDANIINALGGIPKIVAPTYPGPLPGDIGPDGERLIIHLLPFGQAAMKQGMEIEQPEDPIEIPMLKATQEADAGKAVTIGEFYTQLDNYLRTLPASDWHANRNQISDGQFFPGQLFAVNGYEDAHRAIQVIISEGEGSANDPLDFQQEMAHYYRFEEMFFNKVITQDTTSPSGYRLEGSLGIDWSAAYPAIADPQLHNFSNDSAAAQQAQQACTLAYSAMVDALNLAFQGQSAQLGIAVQRMFDLRMASIKALNTPLADGRSVSGPAFLYVPAPQGV